ncbi:MAG: hypothetical protein OXH13_04925 [Chloroflexi bacterium]|nr:hypothetical protein [Chloroflexota bacterium]MCY3696155.1 hypothetical protein [Chloroflexota bacterium]
MWKLAIIALLLAAIAVPTALFATQAQQGPEVRINAYKHEDGRIRFALRVREGDDWSERISPEVNVLASDAEAGRWYRSSSVFIEPAPAESHMPAEEDAPAPSSDPLEGHTGQRYEWTYTNNNYEATTLVRHRVEWATQYRGGDVQHIRVTVPDDEQDCYGDPCRFEIRFYCAGDTGPLALLSRYWLVGDRVWKGYGGNKIGFENRAATTHNRITTSIDSSGFSDAWQFYYPRNQRPGSANWVYGGDFLLESDAALALLREAKDENELTFTLYKDWGSAESWTFDLTGAFDNPAASEIERCQKRE